MVKFYALNHIRNNSAQKNQNLKDVVVIDARLVGNNSGYKWRIKILVMELCMFDSQS